MILESAQMLSNGYHQHHSALNIRQVLVAAALLQEQRVATKK